MRWWRFNQERFDNEIYRWTEVMPGDVVQSRGTCAWRLKDFFGRGDETRHLVLMQQPVLVVGRIPGIWGEASHEEHSVTFLCVSRHGLIVVVQHLS